MPKIKLTCLKCKAVYHSTKLVYCVCGGKLVNNLFNVFTGGDKSSISQVSEIFNDLFGGTFGKD